VTIAKFQQPSAASPKVPQRWSCSAATIADALNELTSRYPISQRHVPRRPGPISSVLNVYLNEEDIRFLGGEILHA